MATKMASLTRNHIHWVFYTVLFVFIFETSAQTGKADGDSRIISLKGLESNEQTFTYSDSRIEDYDRLTIDIPRQQLLVGAKNHLLRLDLGNLKLLEKVEWKPTSNNAKLCQAKGQPESKCQNFVRVLILHNNSVFSCGTNAFSPTCVWRKSTELSLVEEQVLGIGKCPYDPDYNNTAFMTEDGNLYTGTVLDFTSRDPAILRIMGSANHLRTVQYNSKWLNDPDFVSSYDMGDFIYFFFREPAVEYDTCGKNIYSRVARICKTDRGGNFLLEDNWTTFLKARLNCSLPGSYPFYFDELQATHIDHQRGLMYGVFTTGPTGIYGSAVCVFSLSAFDHVFMGAFKHQETPLSLWNAFPNPNTGIQCPSSSGKRDLITSQSQHEMLMNAQMYQLMMDSVQPATNLPLVMAERERWSHIAVDHVDVKHHERFDVIFVVTLEGVLKKYSILPGSHQACVIEQIPLTEDKSPVKSMQLLAKQGVLFISTKHKVLKIPVHRCGRYTTKGSCLRARDPYCGWHERFLQCSTAPPSKPYTYWHQNVSSCPSSDLPVDGGWSRWSDWETCQQVGNSALGDACRCRHRVCDSPKPQAGGHPCTGSAVEVQNCTVHGGWTEWSSWGSCSTSCGEGMRARTRSCTNPAPKFGGSVCVGPDTDEQYCKELPPCPVARPNPVNGSWTAWSAWSTCSVPCGSGISSRFRTCDSPPPSYGGLPCLGNDRMWTACNTQDCEEVKKSSDWTPWMKFNLTHDGYMERRFRFVCKAEVPDPRKLRVTGIKTDLRVCSHDSSSCADRGEEVNLADTIDMSLPLNRSVTALCKDVWRDLQRRQKSRKKESDEIYNPEDKQSIYPIKIVENTSKTGSKSEIGINEVSSKGKYLNDATFKRKRRHRNPLEDYCWCRDLGKFRICRKCSDPPV